MKSYLKYYMNCKGAVYVTSDLHLGHKNILDFGSRGEMFSDIEAHDEAVIANINRTVDKEDLLIVLGDVAFGGKETLKKLKDVKCKMVLVKGNHDSWKDEVYKPYFEMVLEEPVMLSKRIIASHHPLPMEKGYLVNFHGHLHDHYLDSKSHFNVNIELNNGCPVPLQKFIDQINRMNLKGFHQKEHKEGCWYTALVKEFDFNGKK